MSQSAVTCRPRRSDEHAVSLRCISQSCQPLSSRSVLHYRTEILSFTLSSRPLSAGAAEKSGFQILIKRRDSFLKLCVCACVSKVDLCVYMPSFQRRKEGSGPGLCLQVYVLHHFPPLKR